MAFVRRIGNFGPIRNMRTYLGNLANDYKSVALDTVQDAKNDPFKATVYGSALAFLFYAYKTNPGENSFREQLISTYTDMGLVSEITRNPNAYDHVVGLNKLDSSRVLKTINFAFFSVIVRLDYDPNCGLFVANCNYLKPSYLTYLRERVVDFGALGSWHVLNRRLRDYDVNPNEWTDAGQQRHPIGNV